MVALLPRGAASWGMRGRGRRATGQRGSALATLRVRLPIRWVSAGHAGTMSAEKIGGTNCQSSVISLETKDDGAANKVSTEIRSGRLVLTASVQDAARSWRPARRFGSGRLLECFNGEKFASGEMSYC